MPAPHPKEFRDDVVAVARKGEAPLAQIAQDFGISESCRATGCVGPTSRTACVPAAHRRRTSSSKNARRKIRLLEQENEVLRRAAAYLSQANLRLGQSPK